MGNGVGGGHCPRQVGEGVIFYLGTHRPAWLEQTGVPLFVSRRTLAARRRLPRALGRWAMDSGGFSELSMHGKWTIGSTPYAAEVRRSVSEIGGLDWAAIQDWMCEPWILAKTGLDIAEHQARTVQSYEDLLAAAPDLPWAPVLQGWQREDYLRHLDLYLRRGHDLRSAPIVGLGSVCRRQATSEAAQLVRELSGLGLRLHGFGLKQGAFARGAHHQLVSADSLAWSFAARRRSGKCPAGRAKNCANCLHYALEWREGVLSVMSRQVEQLTMESL